jgi:sulfide:quinone oxidoreductase
MRIYESSREPHEVLIAGGGVAALEALLALHALAADRVRVTLLAPNDDYVHRAMAVAEPFGLARARTIGLHDFATAHDAVYVRDRLAAIDAASGEVATGRGRRLTYDSLLVAVGARAAEALPGALTFRGPPDTPAYARLLADLEAGKVERLVFAIPRGVAWTLPLYELALMTAARTAAAGRRPQLTLVTPERAPLGVFGRRPSDIVTTLLREAGVTVRSGAADAVRPGELVLSGGESVPADAVVTLPRIEPPEIPGLPRAARGFVPVDGHCAVEGLDDVYAAGDLTWHHVKQGGIAAQQADAAAQAIAARAGADVVPRPFRPVLRGVLLTGGAPQYMRRTRTDASGETTPDALWWPAGKVAGRYLSSYLAAGTDEDAIPLRDVGAWGSHGDGGEPAAITLALEAADADARWGDHSSALRWLEVAEQLAIVLPQEYAAKRDAWRDALAGVPA